MNNSSDWADLRLEEASGSCSVLWYHDLVDALLLAWHWLFWLCKFFFSIANIPLLFSPSLSSSLGNCYFFSFLLHRFSQAIYPPQTLTYNTDYIVSIFYINSQTISGICGLSQSTFLDLSLFQHRHSVCGVSWHYTVWHWALCGCSRGQIATYSLTGTY